MVDIFSHILRRVLAGNASSFSSHFGVSTLFEVQFNFDIPIFEGKIDTDSLDRWLNLLEGYFLVHNFPDRENITLHSSKSPPMSRIGGKRTVRKRTREKPPCSWPQPIGIISEMPPRNIIIPWGDMRISAYN